MNQLNWTNKWTIFIKLKKQRNSCKQRSQQNQINLLWKMTDYHFRKIKNLLFANLKTK